jgi:hypothetical protein
MRLTSRSGCALLLSVFCAGVVPARAQDEQTLRAFFEGRRVTVTLDMPGTSDGVNIQADSSRPLDSREYGDRIKTNGVAIRSGETVVVTLVKLKKDLIEFQLAGGGFGTFGDDTSTSVSMPLVQKSNREKDLEKAVDKETDRRRRRELQDELNELRDRRERENRRIEVARAEAEELKRQRIADQRLRGGSRFNVRYQGNVPGGIKPEEVMAVLGPYVDFSGLRAPRTSQAVPGPDAQQLRKGMSRADAERAMGNPGESASRREGNLTVVTLVFQRSDQRITAEFVEDVLVRYTATSR